ncbi:hypothetical protein O181_007493 [Austropuccinia psidii MF-1]|uniref:EF-hand domain-containing protein n=1 Tax=Austropuccinia psidii MF-1 TaxID=1389203 RepID=A0A9Q3BMA6_9BASI|nr:hypothetical protein [Austropuccinia psidii MF-1]
MENMRWSSHSLRLPLLIIFLGILIDKQSRNHEKDQKYANFLTDADGEGSGKLDGEDFEVVKHKIGQIWNSSPSHPPSKAFESQIIPSTARNFKPRLSSVPSSVDKSSPHPSTARPPALAFPIRPSPVPQPRTSTMPPSELKPVASTSNRRRVERSHLPYQEIEVFQREDHWPAKATSQDLNEIHDPQDSVERISQRVDINSREMIFYDNDRIIPGMASEEMPSEFVWYEDELIN